MNYLSTLLTLCLLLPVAHADKHITWGKSVNGLQLGISPPTDAQGNATAAFDGKHVQAQVYLRNISDRTIQVFPSVYTCLAVGSGGACLASQLQLRPQQGGEPHLVTYQRGNHLWSLDTRSVYGKSAKETIGKIPVTGADLQLEPDAAEGLAIELEPGDSTWEIIRYTPHPPGTSAWQAKENTATLKPGTYRASVQLVIDQAQSKWKGSLATGTINIDLGQVK